MITTLSTEDKYVYAYCEWTVVDDLGGDDDNGNFMFVRDFWVHNNYRPHGFKNLIIKMEMLCISKPFKWVYWNNRKHDRLINPIPRERMVKYAGG